MAGNTPTDSKANDIEFEITIGDFFFCPKTTQDTATTDPTFDENVIRLPNVNKIAFKGNGKATDIFASGKKFGTINQETSIEATLTHIGLPIAVLDAMKGVTAKHGVEFGTTEAKQGVEFAIGFDTILSNGVHDAMWLPSVVLNTAINDSHETSTDSFKEVDPDTVFEAGGLRNSSIYYARYNNARDSADITVDDFLKQVIYSPEQLETVAGKATPVDGGTDNGAADSGETTPADSGTDDGGTAQS